MIYGETPMVTCSTILIAAVTNMSVVLVLFQNLYQYCQQKNSVTIVTTPLGPRDRAIHDRYMTKRLSVGDAQVDAWFPDRRHQRASHHCNAAGPFAAVQALIPTLQLRVLIIVGASVTDCRNRQHDSKDNKRCMPKVIVHLTPGLSLQSRSSFSRINMRSFLGSPLVIIGQGPHARYDDRDQPIN